MSEPEDKISGFYALGRLQRALNQAQNHPDPSVRERAEKKAEKWMAVLSGMESGTLKVGSRTPVADTPAWVTLEVAHGGFATGRYMAEGDLLEHEREILNGLDDRVPGSTERERLNNYYLSDSGLAQLWEALESGRFSVEVPEEGALPTVVWLLEKGLLLQAFDLLEKLAPLKHRLRFYPRLMATPKSPGNLVRVETVGEVVEGLQAVKPQMQVAAMNEALRVWNPLYDRLVALWLETIEGEAPLLEDGKVTGGWPCKHFPEDWQGKRSEWLRAYGEAENEHKLCGKHRHRKSNFGRLQRALVKCIKDSSQLDGREVGLIRRALANTLTRRGEPTSERRLNLRELQASQAALPTKIEFRDILVRRLQSFAEDSGLPELRQVLEDVGPEENKLFKQAFPIPVLFHSKVERALEATVEELVDKGVITSSEVLAKVLPQITSQIRAAGLADPILCKLFTQVYAAFRRRRSLLLLNFEKQVQLDELPWVASISKQRDSSADSKREAHQALINLSLLAFSAFPQTPTPNPLVREMVALSKQANLNLPLTEELAADIFMGSFTKKWFKAFEMTQEYMSDSLYARYFDLPKTPPKTQSGFVKLCNERSEEAKAGSGSWVAQNGAVIEQSQILTSHNLVALVYGLKLEEEVAKLSPQLCRLAFNFVVRRQNQVADDWRARLQMVKNTGYAWRQGIFFLSFCSPKEREQILAEVRELAKAQKSCWWELFSSALHGLEMICRGHRFEKDGCLLQEEKIGRRFLGWSVGQHWLLKQSP